MKNNYLNIILIWTYANNKSFKLHCLFINKTATLGNQLDRMTHYSLSISLQTGVLQW